MTDRRRSLARNRRPSSARRPARKPRSASSRGSMSSSGCSWTPSSSRPPQTTHRPGQSGRHSGAIGSASWIASRTGVSRSSSWWSVRRGDVGLVVDRQRPPGGQVEGGQVLLLRSATVDADRRCRAGSGCTRAPGRRQVGGRRGSRGWSGAAGPGRRSAAASSEVRRPGRSRRRRPRSRARRRDSSARRPATFQTSGPSAWPHASPRGLWTVRRPRPPSARSSGSARPARRSSTSSVARRSSSIAIPFLMLWSVLTTSPSSPTSTLDRVFVGAAADLVRVRVGVGRRSGGSAASAACVSPRSSIRKAACSWALATIRSASSWAFSMIRSPSELIRLAARTSSGRRRAARR